MVRFLISLLLVLALIAGGAYFIASRAEGPGIDLQRPMRLVGSKGVVEVLITTPGGALDSLEMTIEQGATTVPLFSLQDAPQGSVQQVSADVIRVSRAYDRAVLGALGPGPARLIVRAVRPVLFGLRNASAEAVRDIELRFQPPRLTVVSLHHYINHGGSELVVYRAEPAEVDSGVRVGDVTYPGFPGSAAGIAGAGPELKVAFFALRHDQDLGAPIELVATDEAGNEAKAAFETRVFPKNFRRSRIELDEAFIRRVTGEIVARSADAQALVKDVPEEDHVQRFLKLNGDLRQKNAETIEALAKKTAPRLIWNGPFVQLSNSQVEAGFADYRTYFYEGREIDQQVHLGFDLAVTANVPVRAANRGIVAWADYLGIYGNCVVLDHGMGLQSLYGHLSSIGVAAGDTVEKNQELGRSGMTGLAGGDHLHFTMLLDGHPVTPVEWWDAHWIEDRILRKLKQALLAPPGAV